MTRSIQRSYALPLAVFSLVLLLAAPASAQEVTGLAGWDIFLDQGHSMNENQGFAGYSEAHKTLRVGLALEELLEMQTDIDSVWVSRRSDNVDVSLSQRVDFANRVGAAHFHSIHSNAAGPSANYLFILWAQDPDGSEAVPNGGKLMSELMAPPLSEGMRIPMARGDGAIGECDFYGASSCRPADTGTGKGGSRNFVQSFTDMPSELSEAGFHTNPTQNQRNMNADWKRLEAQAMFWGILAYHDVERPPAYIATGIIRDIETNQPLNGATISVGDTSYTTDTYASLFHKYSNTPGELRNGFYYLDKLSSGTHAVTVEKEGYRTITDTSVTLQESHFTFFDVEMISTIPPTITGTTPPTDDTLKVNERIILNFSRKMDTASVAQALTISPDIEGDLLWRDNQFRLIIDPDSLLQPLTDYTLTIDETAHGFYNDPLDGNGDGTGGDGYTLNFTSGPEDAEPPVLASSYPTPGLLDVPLRSVVNIAFDEIVDEGTIGSSRFELGPTATSDPVALQMRHHVRDGQSVISFFPQERLRPDTYYRIRILPGVEDLVGNVTDAEMGFVFKTSAREYSASIIDDFEGTVTDHWWQPQQSGSTTGLVTDSTEYTVDATTVNLLSGSENSLRLDYGWDTDAGTWLIREYLGGGAPRSARFTDQDILQVYVYGDGQGNKFRFAVDEIATGDHEVSPWYTVDWTGWRLVSWDIDEDGTGNWIGDGTVEGELRFDSFQLSYTEGSEPFGTYYFDDLRSAVTMDPVANEPAASVPDRIALHQNYPNPFSGETTFRFDVKSRSNITLAVYDVLGKRVAVVKRDAAYGPGTHDVVWRPSNLPSGVYFARMQVGEVMRTIKLVHVK